VQGSTLSLRCTTSNAAYSYSIQLDMFLQDMVIQMALCEGPEDGHSPCTKSRRYCNRDLQVRIVLIFLIDILP
jgi:hypothetical protein